MASARDVKKYGILGIRGKIINCLAHPEEKIFENEEIKLLLSAMNIVPGKYDSKKLRYGKIAICTDADSDGYHIGLLIMSALRYLAPQFLKRVDFVGYVRHFMLFTIRKIVIILPMRNLMLLEVK